MVALEVVLGNLAGVLTYLFGQEVGGVSFLQQQVAFVFLVGQDRADRAGRPVVLPFTVFSPRLVSSWLMLLMECPSMNSWWIRRTVGTGTHPRPGHHLRLFCIQGWIGKQLTCENPNSESVRPP